MDIEVKPIPKILVEDVLKFFYIFQMFGLVVWIANEFYAYSVAIFVMLFVSIWGELYTIYSNLVLLNKMAFYEYQVDVFRIDDNGEGRWIEISSLNLVPGDIIETKQGLKLPWDAIMLHGESVINEAMLTGESAPVVKESIPNTQEVVETFNIENKSQVRPFI